MKPAFEPGRNIAVKVPAHQFDKTVSFYRDILGFKLLELAGTDQFESVAFDFGGKTLWIDKCAALSQAEIWLEIMTDDKDAAAQWFDHHTIARRDEIEPLPETVDGFWIAGPSDIIHLVNT